MQCTYKGFKEAETISFEDFVSSLRGRSCLKCSSKDLSVGIINKLSVMITCHNCDRKILLRWDESYDNVTTEIIDRK